MKKQKYFIYILLLTILVSIFPINTTYVNAKEQVIRVGYDQNSHFIQEKNGEYSLILCNPPYKKKNSGGTNPEGHIAICRHEIAVTLEEIIQISAKKLKHGGRLAMCQRVERLTDMLSIMRANKIEPYKLQFVISGDEQKPYLFLVEGVKGVCRQLTVLETIRN